MSTKTIITPPDKMDKKRLGELLTEARTVLARLETITGDGLTIHDRNKKISHIVNDRRLLLKYGEHTYTFRSWSMASGKSSSIVQVSYNTLDAFEETIEKGRRWASRHGG